MFRMLPLLAVAVLTASVLVGRTRGKAEPMRRRSPGRDRPRYQVPFRRRGRRGREPGRQDRLAQRRVLV